MPKIVPSRNNDWSFTKKFAMLFVICYAFFYMFPAPFSEVPGIGFVLSFYTKPLEAAVLWFGKAILGLITLEKIEVTGSGDTTFDYVKLLFVFLVSVIVSLSIAVVGKKKNYQRWFDLVWIYARYYVGLYMIIYALAKFFGGQFSFPYIARLENTYGDSSPMGLLWTFMGYSKTYTIFGGLLELIAGVLLLFRRTTIVGSLIAIAVMVNVAALNFCYDVCVKLFSIHLVLLSLLILSPYVGRLFRFAFLQEQVKLKVESLSFDKKWQRIGRIVFKVMIIGTAIVGFVLMIAETGKSNTDSKYANSFDGAYEVITFVKNSDTIPALKTDSIRWNKMILQEGGVNIITMTHKKAFYSVKTDTIKKNLIFTSYDDSTKVFQFDYKLKPNKLLYLYGKYQSNNIQVLCKKKTINEYLLVNRGFHWINERAFNK